PTPSSTATNTPTVTDTPTNTNTPTATPTKTPTPPGGGCPSCDAIPAPPSPVIVTDCSGTGSSPVSVTSSWTQISLVSSDVILRCPLVQLSGTSGVRILAHSIKVDGSAGGSVSSTGTGGTQLLAGSTSGQCNSTATVDLEFTSVAGSNTNDGVKISGCGNVVVNATAVSSGSV